MGDVFFSIKNTDTTGLSGGKEITMSEFKIIETQEQLDAIMKDRLARKEKAVREEYADYEMYKSAYENNETVKSDYDARIDEMQKQHEESKSTIDSLNTRIAQYEIDSVKTKACVKHGIPFEMMGRLQGENEEEIMKDASVLASYLASNPTAPPMRNPEAKVEEDGVMAAFKKLNPNIKI